VLIGARLFRQRLAGACQPAAHLPSRRPVKAAWGPWSGRRP